MCACILYVCIHIMYVWRILLSSSSERSEQHSATKQRRQTPDTPLFTTVMHQSVHRGCTHRLLVHILLKSLMMTCSIGEPESRSAEARGIYYYDHTVMIHEPAGPFCLWVPFSLGAWAYESRNLMSPIGFSCESLWVPKNFLMSPQISYESPNFLMSPQKPLWVPKFRPQCIESTV